MNDALVPTLDAIIAQCESLKSLANGKRILPPVAVARLLVHGDNFLSKLRQHAERLQPPQRKGVG